MDIETLFNMLDGAVGVVCHVQGRRISVWHGGNSVNVYDADGVPVDAWESSSWSNGDPAPMTDAEFRRLAIEHVEGGRHGAQ